MYSSQAIADAVKAAQTLIPIGGGTKAALSACDASVTRIDMRALSGIVSYDASEYLISACSGTPISELASALAERKQFLPFDPLFAAQGATLGGTLASGISGSNRLLYGSLRDFVMEVELVDGLGRLVRGGGKVVKNAAGFDLPKLIIGSYGRLGVITEATLKVFPEPPASFTWMVDYPHVQACISAVQKLLAQPLPIAALDVESANDSKILVRFAGPESALPNVLARATNILGKPGQSLSEAQVERSFWAERSATLAQVDGVLIRIASSLEGLTQLVPELKRVEGAKFWHTGAGATTWLRLPENSDLAALSQLLAKHKLPAVVVQGGGSSLQVLGNSDWRNTARKIQLAIDPSGKFLPY